MINLTREQAQQVLDAFEVATTHFAKDRQEILAARETLRARLSAPEPKEFTDKEKIVYDILCSDETPPNGQHWEGFVAQKIVEALAQPEPEPVAWLDSDGFPWSKEGMECRSTKDTYEPLYTTPPQREWQGLTEQDFSAINQSCSTKLQAATSAESILKEKNT